MKAIALSNVHLRLLNIQLQQYQQGFTIAELRSLDKVAKILNSTLHDFNKTLDELKGDKDQEKLDAFVESEGQKIVTVNIEDTDFEFIKTIWNKMSGFTGVDSIREAVLAIDDAIKVAETQVFTN